MLGTNASGYAQLSRLARRNLIVASSKNGPPNCWTDWSEKPTKTLVWDCRSTMTSRHRVSLSAAAQADLRSILQYTLERQGAEQRRIVRERFAQVMRDLAAFPNLGRSRDDILPGLRNFPIMSHIIFYS